jgi:hypothetical protein
MKFIAAILVASFGLTMMGLEIESGHYWAAGLILGSNLYPIGYVLRGGEGD